MVHGGLDRGFPIDQHVAGEIEMMTKLVLLFLLKRFNIVRCCQSKLQVNLCAVSY